MNDRFMHHHGLLAHSLCLALPRTTYTTSNCCIFLEYEMLQQRLACWLGRTPDDGLSLAAGLSGTSQRPPSPWYASAAVALHTHRPLLMDLLAQHA